MPQSLSKIYLHIVFHIKTTSPKIHESDLGRVQSYIGGLIKAEGCRPIVVGGIDDHVHVLCLLSTSETISKLVEEMKRNSSRWIKSIDAWYRDFEWQGGYGVFSVSQSVVDKTKLYIENQQEHHRHTTFEEEYLSFLKLYGIEYDERYVFSD